MVLNDSCHEVALSISIAIWNENYTIGLYNLIFLKTDVEVAGFMREG